jgi:1D-myo-inositol-tetrakisphosphate 5-kinase/inositol-polyphosphate multikinase
MSSADGSMIMKACLPAEKNFYEMVVSEAGFAHLRDKIPKFFGTLKLAGKVDVDEAGNMKQGSEVKPVPEGEKESLVLENVSHPFYKANILDVKLGTVLYEEGATEEKKERMIQTAKNTTSFESGIRLTGFQVYDSKKDIMVNTPKSYGKSITVSQLPEGVAKFFSISSEGSGEGVLAPLLLRVLKGVVGAIEEIEEAFKGTELRMVGGSLLIVWEGDEAALRKAFEEEERVHENDSEEDEDDDLEEIEEVQGGDGNAQGKGGEKEKVGPPFVVKVIDFAHTRLTPGQGPDEGVLLGIKTTLQLLRQRVHDVEAATAGK